MLIKSIKLVFFMFFSEFLAASGWKGKVLEYLKAGIFESDVFYIVIVILIKDLRKK